MLAALQVEDSPQLNSTVPQLHCAMCELRRLDETAVTLSSPRLGCFAPPPPRPALNQRRPFDAQWLVAAAFGCCKKSRRRGGCRVYLEYWKVRSISKWCSK